MKNCLFAVERKYKWNMNNNNNNSNKPISISDLLRVYWHALCIVCARPVYGSIFDCMLTRMLTCFFPAECYCLEVATQVQSYLFLVLWKKLIWTGNANFLFKYVNYLREVLILCYLKKILDFFIIFNLLLFFLQNYRTNLTSQLSSYKLRHALYYYLQRFQVFGHSVCEHFHCLLLHSQEGFHFFFTVFIQSVLAATSQRILISLHAHLRQ